MVRTGSLETPESHLSSDGVVGSVSRKGRSSRASVSLYTKGYFSALGSRKKSNGLKTAISATRSTSTRNSRGRFRKHQPSQIVALGVLLPVQEMLLGLDVQRIRQNRRAAMRRRTQSDDLRPQGHRTVIAVFGFMIERYVDSHGLWNAVTATLPRLSPATRTKTKDKAFKDLSIPRIVPNEGTGHSSRQVAALPLDAV